jgi:geranylgeranyl reductase family protein
MNEFDIVIIGAGTAGSFAAQLAAHKGLKVALLDRKPEHEVGDKICGDEISETHFESVGLEKPKGDEISCEIRGADLYPPNIKNPLVLREWKEFNGWTVNRIVFGQRMLIDAISEGAEFFPLHHVNQAIKKEKSVVGVKAKNRNTKTNQEFRGKIVIDASGYPGVLRMQLEDPLIEKEINPHDIAVCYREIVELPNPWHEEGIAEVIMSIDGVYADHGYCWLFPKGGKLVNVGTGVRGGKGITNPKFFFDNLVRDHPKLQGAKTISGGADVVPVRRPIWSLVTDGLVFIGDAALQVNPMHGGGIGRGLRAAKIAINTITQALENGNVSASNLWEYNQKFHSQLSSRLAPMDLFRIFIQTLSDEELNYGFARKIIEAEDLMSVNRGEDVGLSTKEKLIRFTRGIGKVGMLRKLQRTLKAMKTIKEIYQQYPSTPEGLTSFKSRVLHEYSRIRV